MIDKTEIEIEDLRTHLTEAQAKLFEAGKLAGQQQLTIDALMAAVAALESKIDRLNIAGSQALVQLEQAHEACHEGELQATLDYIAQAMESLANDD